MDSSVLLAIGGGAVAVLFAGLLTAIVLGKPPGNERMVEIAAAIQEGASAYLNRQYVVIAVIGLIIAVIIGVALSWVTAILYLMGANERHVLCKVVLPSAITWVFTGLRISVPYALIGAIGSSST